jgi:glycosyltransferase involved in cell wall biosynthesis
MLEKRSYNMSESSEPSRRYEFRRIVSAAVRVYRQQGVLALATQLIEKVRRREFALLGASVLPDEFEKWIKANEPSSISLTDQIAQISHIEYRPLISLVTPVWNPRPEILKSTIQSVIAQTYDNWELCIADGGSRAIIRDLLNDYAKSDERIHVTSLKKNLGISANTNRAIEAARGEFVGFLDQDDVLAPFALSEIALFLNGQKDSDLIYSDMDRIDADDVRFDPLFKPEWSPEIMLCANYVVHFCAIRRSILLALGGLRSETDGAQDWDLILRLSERTNRIARIPKLLYHWRQSPISTATRGLRFKPVAIEAQLRAITQFMSRNNMKGTLGYEKSGSFRVNWSPDNLPMVSIIVSGDLDPKFFRCLYSVKDKSSFDRYEIVVVASSVSSLAQNSHEIRFIRTSEKDFGAASNLGVQHSNGNLLIFLDPHSEVITPDWIQEMTGWAMQPWAGAVGCKLISRDKRTIKHGGVILGLPGYLFQGAPVRSWSPLGHTDWYRNLSAVSGACLATRRLVFNEMRGFNTNVANADVDYCLRVGKSNYRIIYTPFATLTLDDCNCHEYNRTAAGLDGEYISRIGDPYFNPNLSTDKTIPHLKLT